MKTAQQRIERYQAMLNLLKTAPTLFAQYEADAAKLSEFETKLAQLNKELDEDLIAGESIEWADEAMTVYYNLIDLLKKLTA